MYDRPLISIIVPAYNTEKYITKCIDSLLTQTYKNIEVVIVDDGSKDHTGEILDSFAQRDNRVVVIHTPNGGLSRARNTAIKASKGEWLFFTDSDDFVELNTLERMIDVASETNADLIVCAANRYVDGKKCGFNYKLPSGLLSHCEFFEQMYLQEDGYDDIFLPFVVAWTKLIKRDTFDTAKWMFPEGHVYEDNWSIHHFIMAAKKIYWLNEPLYNWRYVEGSISHSKFSHKKFDDFYAQRDRLDFLRNHYENELFYTKMVERCIRCGIYSYNQAKINATSENAKEVIAFRNDVVDVWRDYKKYSHNLTYKIKWFLFVRIDKLYRILAKTKVS